LNSLEKKFNGIICGFTIPYLSINDCKKFIFDCSNHLKNEGILYLSYVAGENKNSGFISGSSGDRTYFYYHNTQDLVKELTANRMGIVDLIDIDYLKSDNSIEVHSIIIAKKLEN
jgi:hypothetical protein